jgi:glycine cleavage system H protein
MPNIYFTRDHEYIRVDGDTGVVGVTDHAQQALGDIVYVELPQVGAAFKRGDQVAVVESVKAASEVFAPVGGEIVDINGALEKEPGAVNEEPLGKGWFYKMRVADPAELDGLLDEAAYAAFLKSLA